MNTWISIKEQQPEPGQFVLVYDGNEMSVMRTDTDAIGWFVDGACERMFSGVTHWMLLPLPPVK
jgi:hypothetical protein